MASSAPQVIIEIQNENTMEKAAVSREDNSYKHCFLERQARRVARWPRIHLCSALFIAFSISIWGMWSGEFKIDFDSIGWPSRGTLVADRQSQLMLVNQNKECLAQADNEHCWEDLTTNVQLGWEIVRLNINQKDEEVQVEALNETTLAPSYLTQESLLSSPEATSPSPTNIMELLDQCDVSTYSDPGFFVGKKLWPVWKVTDDSASAMDPPLLQEICEAEQVVQTMLHREGLCYGCNNGQCLPPLSIVLYARVKVGNGFELNCQELAEAWAPHQAEEEEEWRACVKHQETATDFRKERGPCSTFFSPSMVDNLFAQTGRVAYTSSIFVTNNTMDKDIYDRWIA